jgi:hypothetical protein
MMANPVTSGESGGTVVEREPTCLSMAISADFLVAMDTRKGSLTTKLGTPGFCVGNPGRARLQGAPIWRADIYYPCEEQQSRAAHCPRCRSSGLDMPWTPSGLGRT